MGCRLINSDAWPATIFCLVQFIWRVSAAGVMAEQVCQCNFNFDCTATPAFFII